MALAAALCSSVRAAEKDAAFRPPAVPLVVSDPYLSIWSEADKLTDDVTRHWTHRPHALGSLIRIDGKTYRLMGVTPANRLDGEAYRSFGVKPIENIPPLPQNGVHVLPTRSIYDFENAQVHVTLTFLTPLLPHDLDVLARPVTYLTWNVRARDGRSHDVALYDSVSGEITVNTPDEKVTWKRGAAGNLTTLQIGSEDQPVLGSAGDDIRINWGYAYLAALSRQSHFAIDAEAFLIHDFIVKGRIGPGDSMRFPRPVSEGLPTMAVAFDLGKVSATPVERRVMVAYDEVYAIKYFGKKLRPYWRRNGDTPASLLQMADRDYSRLLTKCEAFDREFLADAKQTGGARYAQIAALAYRQCLAGTGIAADANKQPLLFTKENNSNGDIATVDVIFPMEPMLLLFSPTLAKASLVPILAYAASSHWNFPNAPHDLGTYPIARGTDDGGEGMPVEESGNMLLLCDAICRAERSPAFVAKWWPQLTQWEQYLEKYGNDPEDQLCTDDFMGHLAHNANLSVKAILAIAAYGDLCRMRGDTQTADRVYKLARGFALHWTQVANDGNHSRLAFDKPNTWSQKYNLVWDKILGLNVFPASVARQEVAYYKSVMQPYGVPLDSRTRLTKTDWSLWSATLADKQSDFEAMVSPIYDYLNQTTARMPLVDSYVTDNIKSEGMHARPVVGGIFVKMLADGALWKKWSSGDTLKVGGWAELPPPPHITPVVATSQQTAQIWQYTTAKPSGDWTQPGFDDRSWKTGKGGFGTPGTPGAVVGTEWNTGDIWLRRSFTMPAGAHPNLQLFVYHDEDVEIYINGVLAARQIGFTSAYEPMPMGEAARRLLPPGAKITLAVHCHQTGGGQGVDVGFADVVESH